MAQETATEKKTNPIVKFLRIPENYPDEAAYFWGMQCGSCDAKFLGARLACGKCGDTDKLSEVTFGDEGGVQSVFARRDPTVAPDEVQIVCALHQQLRHDRVVVIVRGQMTIGAHFCFALSSHGVRFVRAEGDAAGTTR